MNLFFPGFEEFEAQKEQEATQNYDVRMLKKLLSIVVDKDVAKEIEREGGNEVGFEWFNAAFNPPVHMTAVKLAGYTADKLLVKSFLRDPMGTAFFDIRRSTEDTVPVGMIFPVKSGSNWIIHDSKEIPIIAGVTVVIRKGNDDSRLTVMPFEPFVEGLKLKWQP